MKDGFVLYSSYDDVLDELSAEQMGVLFKAILRYKNKGELIELPPELRILFKFIKNQLDLDDAKYEKKLESAKKGGRPTAVKEEKPEPIKEIDYSVNRVETVKIDPCTNPLIDECFKTYEKECKDLCKLGFEPKNLQIREKLADFLNEIDGNISYFKELCRKANKLKHICDKPIDFKAVISNHIGIMNGRYIKKGDEPFIPPSTKEMDEKIARDKAIHDEEIRKIREELDLRC